MGPNTTPNNPTSAYNVQPTLNSTIQQLSAIQAQGLNPSLPHQILSGPQTFGGGTRYLEGQLPNNIGYGQLFYDPAGVDRIILYFDSTGQPRFRISKTGKSVINGSGDDFSLNSDNNVMKIVDTGTFNFQSSDFASSGNAYLTKVATHTITYPAGVTDPIVWVFIEDALGERTPLPSTVPDPDTGAISYWAKQLMSKMSTVVEVRATAALAPFVNFRYYTLVETAKGT